MESIIVLRAKITSLAVAALWSCADAIQLVPSTAAASTTHPTATAIRRRERKMSCSKLITFHLRSQAFANCALSTQNHRAAQKPRKALSHQERCGDVGEDRTRDGKTDFQQEIGHPGA